MTSLGEAGPRSPRLLSWASQAAYYGLWAMSVPLAVFWLISYRLLATAGFSHAQLVEYAQVVLLAAAASLSAAVVLCVLAVCSRGRAALVFLALGAVVAVQVVGGLHDGRTELGITFDLLVQLLLVWMLCLAVVGRRDRLGAVGLYLAWVGVVVLLLLVRVVPVVEMVTGQRQLSLRAGSSGWCQLVGNCLVVVWLGMCFASHWLAVRAARARRDVASPATRRTMSTG